MNMSRLHLNGVCAFLLVNTQYLRAEEIENIRISLGFFFGQINDGWLDG